MNIKKKKEYNENIVNSWNRRYKDAFKEEDFNTAVDMVLRKHLISSDKNISEGEREHLWDTVSLNDEACREQLTGGTDIRDYTNNV